jgi:ketosteroid isomerase-like protein
MKMRELRFMHFLFLPLLIIRTSSHLHIGISSSPIAFAKKQLYLIGLNNCYMKQILFFLMIAVVITACESTSAKSDTPAAFNVDSVKAHIDAHNVAFSSAMINGDSAAIVPMYMSDATIMPPNEPGGKGGAVMARMSKQVQALGATQFKVWATSVEGNSDMVVEEGKWEIRGANMKDGGKFLVIWKQTNGQWKVAKDIWNSDYPPTK